MANHFPAPKGCRVAADAGINEVGREQESEGWVFHQPTTAKQYSDSYSLRCDLWSSSFGHYQAAHLTTPENEKVVWAPAGLD